MSLLSFIFGEPKNSKNKKNTTSTKEKVNGKIIREMEFISFDNHDGYQITTVSSSYNNIHQINTDKIINKYGEALTGLPVRIRVKDTPQLGYVADLFVDNLNVGTLYNDCPHFEEIRKGQIKNVYIRRKNEIDNHIQLFLEI